MNVAIPVHVIICKEQLSGNIAMVFSLGSICIIIVMNYHELIDSKA